MDVNNMHMFKILKGIVNNIKKNYRYYNIKIILDLITNSSIFDINKKYHGYKYSKPILVFLCANIVQELLEKSDICPQNYRAFLSKLSNSSGTRNVLVEPNVSFCKQIHNLTDESKCHGTFNDCMVSNFKIFLRNYKILLSLYSKIYAIPWIYRLIIKKDPLYIFSSVFQKIFLSYIKNVNLSCLSLCSFYFVSHGYLTFVEQSLQRPPDKLHYNFSISLGSLCLIMGETKTRLGMITNFMTALYINIFFQKTIPGHENFWKNLFPFLLCFSFLKRGLKNTIVSIL